MSQLNLSTGLGFAIMLAFSATLVATGAYFLITESKKSATPVPLAAIASNTTRTTQISQSQHNRDSAHVILGVILSCAGLVVALLTLLMLGMS